MRYEEFHRLLWDDVAEILKIPKKDYGKMDEAVMRAVRNEISPDEMSDEIILLGKNKDYKKFGESKNE